MTFTTYTMLNVASAVLIGGLGMVIASVRITARTQNRHYRKARTYLSVAFILLALLKLLEVAVPKDDENALTGCIALIVGALQAMCFTASLLLFIRPQWVTRRRLWCQVAAIMLVSVALVLCQVLLPDAHYRVALIAASMLYVALLAYYTIIFRKAYRQFGHDMYDYYQEEDLNRQLRWIGYTFYSSLGVGCMVFLSVSGMQGLDSLFIIIYSAFYVYLTSRFINYGQYVSTVMRAVLPDPEPLAPIMSEPQPEVVEDQEPADEGGDHDAQEKFAGIGEKLKIWVDERQYLSADIGVKDVAAELGTTPRRLSEYFTEVVGEDFVKWRIRLRLDYACRLIDQDPNRPMREVAAEAGFGDRSYFYRKFAEVLGITVTQYKQQASSTSKNEE